MDLCHPFEGCNTVEASRISYTHLPRGLKHEPPVLDGIQRPAARNPSLTASASLQGERASATAH
eukprot:18773-Pelagomonas_calceolata.AAC.5